MKEHLLEVDLKVSITRWCVCVLTGGVRYSVLVVICCKSVNIVFDVGDVKTTFHLFSSPELKAQGELIVYRSSQRPSVCASGRKHFQT